MLYCLVIGALVMPSSLAEEQKADIVKLRGGVANFCRSSLRARTLDRVDGRRKIVYFGHRFFHEANTYTPSPRLMLRPAEAAEKEYSFTARVSHYLSSELVRGIEVSRQVREVKPDTEFLLMTGPFGRVSDQDPAVVKNWREFVTPEGTDYRSPLMKVAQEERADFIDMNGILGRYLLNSKYPYGSFQRDPIHANWRGKQLLGRILETYFTPKP